VPIPARACPWAALLKAKRCNGMPQPAPDMRCNCPVDGTQNADPYLNCSDTGYNYSLVSLVKLISSWKQCRVWCKQTQSVKNVSPAPVSLSDCFCFGQQPSELCIGA